MNRKEEIIYATLELASEYGLKSVSLSQIADKIGIRKPDPDNGRIYDRLMVSAERAAELLDWGDVGTAQVMKARDIICQKYGIRDTGKPEEWV